MKDKVSAFYALTDEYWDNNMRENPIYATMLGDNRFNDKIGDNSEKSFERRITNMISLRDRLNEIDPTDFKEKDFLNYEIFKRLILNELERMEYRTYRTPISKLSGFYLQFPRLAQIAPFKGLDDYNNYIARLHAIPKYIDETIEIMKMGMENGQIPPRVTMEGVVNSIRTQKVEDVTQNPFYIAFKNFPKSIEDSDRALLLVEGEKAIKDVIYPSLEKFAEFIEKIYFPTLREDIAAINLPGGKEYYQFCIRYFTTLDLTAEEVHEIGMREVKRIRGEMEQVIMEAKFEGDFKDFVNFLRTDPQFYAKTPEELMQKTALVLKKIDGKLPEMFKTLPRLPYGIREIPDYEAPASTTAYYLPGAADGTRSGTYYVNTYDLKSRPLYEIEALSLHEAVPGHHLQIALMMENDLPLFRRFSWITAYGEGWGLYAERLGLECGFYQDVYSNFGRLSYEMWRATRLVVDTGMHALGWSRQQAIDFMLEYTSLTELNINNEVDRYIAWPGQALAYKLGELKIRELRVRAEERLGTRFNLREFHDALLLNGSLPLDILENHIDKWIGNY